jgi:hypothetical protein
MKVLKELKDMKAGSSAPSIWRPPQAAWRANRKAAETQAATSTSGLCFCGLSVRSRPASPGRQIDGAQVRFMSSITFTAFMSSGGT